MSSVALESQVCKDLTVDLVYAYTCVHACMCARTMWPSIAWVNGCDVASLRPPDDLAAIEVRRSLFIPALNFGVLTLHEYTTLNHQWTL